MRKVLILVAAACLVAAVAVIPRIGVASHGSGCTFAYTGTTPRQCAFNLTGLPLTVRGDSEAASARIHVWLTAQGSDEVLVECSAEGAGFASCNEELGVGEGIDTIVGLFPVVCHMSGRGSGEYGCTAGCASPAFGTYCEVVQPLTTPSI